MHADAPQHADGAVAHRSRGHHLHQRQEIHRIERVAYQDLLRIAGAALQLGGSEAGRGRRQRHVPRCVALNLSHSAVLVGQPFRHALLHPGGLGNRGGDGTAPQQRTCGRQCAVV